MQMGKGGHTRNFFHKMLNPSLYGPKTILVVLESNYHYLIFKFMILLFIKAALVHKS